MYNLVSYFMNLGMKNPVRSIELIKKAINFNKLNLSGLNVFTEAASGEFIYTPIIAAMAGAEKVYAVMNDSVYSTKEQVKKNTELFAELCGVRNKIEVVFDKEKISECDIVTNLGFVRPIDKDLIDKMKVNAVIPYMCEAWEVREGDVDIDYCKKKGIKVMGTNENYPGLDVFNFSGPLAIKMLFDSGIEIFKSKIIIISGDKFGNVIYNSLISISEDVKLLNEINNTNIEELKDADALIIADYTSDDCFIGKEGKLSVEKLRQLSKYVTVIQFAGRVNVDELQENKINFYPKYEVGSYRMGKTLAYLGPKPIIDLHCAGLKVGEIMIRKNCNCVNENTLYQFVN